MDFENYFTKQAKWAQKHLCDERDVRKADWWLKQIAELAKLESQVFPPEPPAPVSAQQQATAA